MKGGEDDLHLLLVDKKQPVAVAAAAAAEAILGWGLIVEKGFVVGIYVDEEGGRKGWPFRFCLDDRIRLGDTGNTDLISAPVYNLILLLSFFFFHMLDPLLKM